jgi:hypothetical protein
MTTRLVVSTAIDEAAATFTKCWDTLVTIKKGDVDEFTGPRIGRFQHDLASALLKLDKVFLRIAAAKTALVDRKHAVNQQWFGRRMATLSRYQDALEETIRIGKSIGDSFAWFFYMRETDLIEKHLAVEGQLHMPPGIGAAGELAIIKNIKPFDNNHLVLYHGTTTFLRIGDISLIHMPSLTVSALGEIKTKKTSDSELRISLFLLGDSHQIRRRRLSLGKRRTKRLSAEEMPPGRTAQLRRQMNRMGAALDTEAPDRRLKVTQQSNIHVLDDVAVRLNRQQFILEKLDDGLMLLGVRTASPASRLSSRLLPRTKYDISAILDASEHAAHQIIDKSRRDNSLILDQLSVGFVPGMTPLFWSSVSSSVLRRVAFREIAFQTSFNPVHLVQKLQRAGLEVITGRLGLPATVKKRLGRGTASASAIDTMFSLVTQHLVTEEAFVQFAVQLVQAAERSGAQPNVEVRMSLAQFYGEPPPPIERRYRRSTGRRQGHESA